MDHAPEDVACTGRTLVLDVPARLDLVTVVRMVVASAATAENALSGDRVDDLRWVVSEAVTNAVEASLLSSDHGRIRITCQMLADGVALDVEDNGPGMPTVVDEHHIEDPGRLSIEGGFGIQLMRRLSSGPVEFQSTPAGTTVTLQVRQ
ncbi:MAG: ATP-binding protein [Acidimicrobiales bacterium]